MDVVHEVCASGLFVCTGKDDRPNNDNNNNKWKFIAKMNEARYKFKVVSCGKIMSANGGGGETLKSTECYDDVTDKLTVSTSMIEKGFGNFFF